MKHTRRLILLAIVFGIIVLVVNLVDLSLDTNVSEEEVDNNTVDTPINIIDADDATGNEDSDTEEEVVDKTEDKIQLEEEHGFYVPELEEIEEIDVTAQESTTVYEIDSDNAISVMPAADASIVVGSYGADTQEEVVIDGYTGTRYTGTSPKDGSVIHYILVTVGDDVYFIRGTKKFLDTTQQELTFDQ